MTSPDGRFSMGGSHIHAHVHVHTCVCHDQVEVMFYFVEHSETSDL